MCLKGKDNCKIDDDDDDKGNGADENFHSLTSFTRRLIYHWSRMTHKLCRLLSCLGLFMSFLHR